MVPAATSFQEDCGESFVEGLTMLKKKLFHSHTSCMTI